MQSYNLDKTIEMYSDEELIPISALNHLLFCKRRFALVHIEQLWQENLFTAQGQIMHERVDREDQVDRGKVKIEYGLPMKSARLGLTGKADVVEFHRSDSSVQKWVPFPVEYKRGKPKKDLTDKVQLCAQALCLEEMLYLDIPAGALFYGKTRRRLEVDFDEHLRNKTIEAAKELHAMIDSGVTPPPKYCKKCESCSLVSLCLPKTIGKRKTVASWLKRMVREDIT